jgi:hypothetical protein
MLPLHSFQPGESNMTNRFRIEKLEERIAPSVVTSTFKVKVPGPTDDVVTTATNPGGNHPPGHQSVIELSNRLAK